MTKTPDEFMEAADIAFKNGDWDDAQKIAFEALKCYPDDREIQKYAEILANPSAIFAPREVNANRDPFFNWLKKNKAQYRGSWVALQNGELLAVGNTREEIIAKLSDEKDKLILITLI